MAHAFMPEHAADPRKTILIVEGDIGFLMWLGELLSQAGHRPLPALNGTDAIRLIEELNTKVDLLIADPEAAGIAEVAGYLREQNAALKILTTSPEPPAGFPVDAVLPKPEDEAEPGTRHQWQTEISRLLESTS